MISHCFYALVATAIFGMLMPRIGMRLLKEVCPSYFARLNNFLSFGVSEALETYDDDLWGADGPDMEQEAFPTVLKASLLLAFLASEAAALLGAGLIGVVFFSFLGSALPAIAGLFTIVVGIPVKLIRFNLGCGKLAYAPPEGSASRGKKKAKVYTDGLADHLYDSIADRVDHFKEDPIGSFTFADRLYDWLTRPLRRSHRR